MQNLFEERLRETPEDVETKDKSGNVKKSHSEKVTQECYDHALATVLTELGQELADALTKVFAI